MAHSRDVVSHLPCLTLMLLACVGCGCHSEKPTVITGELAKLVDKSLLTGEPCAPPCWQGITPGVTSETEAVEILSGVEFVDADSISINESYSISVYDWKTTFDKGRNNRSEDTVFFDQDGITEGIFVRELWYQLSLQELIDVIGEPAGIRIIRTPHPDGGYFNCMSISVVWFGKGLEAYVAYVPTSTTDSTVMVRPDQTISGVIYFPPVSSQEEYTSDSAFFYSPHWDTFVPWEGFKD